MEIKTKKLLTDILICVENIDRYVGEHKVFIEYENNPIGYSKSQKQDSNYPLKSSGYFIVMFINCGQNDRYFP